RDRPTTPGKQDDDPAQARAHGWALRAWTRSYCCRVLCEAGLLFCASLLPGSGLGRRHRRVDWSGACRGLALHVLARLLEQNHPPTTIRERLEFASAHELRRERAATGIKTGVELAKSDREGRDFRWNCSLHSWTPLFLGTDNTPLLCCYGVQNVMAR